MYQIRVFPRGAGGYYQYNTGEDLDQAMDHFAKIVANGYRRVNNRGQLIQIMPSEIAEIRCIGPDLDTKYPDEFVRT